MASRWQTARYGQSPPSGISEVERIRRQGGVVGYAPNNAPTWADMGEAELRERLANARAVVAQIEAALASKEAKREA